ncbi:MAG: hypothetical protein JXR48_03700 [Candidatus Delongbacteria bacterium]|nr:hypothetical protein [Candidatus Delongbacteria bacterium]
MLKKLLKISSSTKNITVCYRNSGFGDNLFQAACSWLFSKNNDRDLLINWSNSRYLTNKKINSFFYFFEIDEVIDGVKVIKLTDVNLFLKLRSIGFMNIAITLTYRLLMKINFKAKFLYSLKDNYYRRAIEKEKKILGSLNNINRIVFIRGCHHNFSKDLKPFFDSLKPAKFIDEKIDKYTKQNFEGFFTIGLHIRYYNKAMYRSDYSEMWENESECLNQIKNKIKEVLSNYNLDNIRLFLATDSSVTHEFINKNFDNVISYNKDFGNDVSKELHDQLPSETAEASIIEMFLLSRCDLLVRLPADSWFSYYASLYTETFKFN